MKNFSVLVVVVSAFLLSGCSAPIVGSLKYAQPVGVETQMINLPGKQVYVATFKDSRDGYPEVSKRIGKLAGAFGSTIQSIEIPQPVAIATSDVIADFLNNAGVNVTREEIKAFSNLTLSGNITEFYCFFHFLHNTNISIDLVLTDNASGKKLWKGSVKKEHAGSIFEKYPIAERELKSGGGLYDGHSKGINVAMNLMFSEGIAEVWEKGGLRLALENAH
jgi:hypothetical protein